jgi:hypothetical protein
MEQKTCGSCEHLYIVYKRTGSVNVRVPMCDLVNLVRNKQTQACEYWVLAYVFQMEERHHAEQCTRPDEA